MLKQGANNAVVTVADRRYLPPACCQLSSVANHLHSDDAQLFLVVCDVSEQDVAHAREFFAKRNMRVEIVVPDFLDDMVQPLKTRWPRAAYLRLYFDRIFDERWQRILYLDADTRVCAPLAPLLHADLRGEPIGAVHDFIYYVTGNIHRRRKDLGLANDAPYFQSGVMLLDWQRMLQCDGLGDARRFLLEHAEGCYEAPDQDALNGAFEDRWTPLDPRWNLHETYLMFGQRYKPKLMHFTSTKPWSKERTRAWAGASRWYRSELADTPWHDFVESQSVLDALRVELLFRGRVYKPRLLEAAANNVPLLLSLFGRQLRPYDHTGGFKPWVPRRAQDVEDMTQALIDEASGGPALRPPEAILAEGHW